MQTVTYTLPLWWAPYLINRDSSGMTESEISTIHAWECEHASLGDALTMEEMGYSSLYGCEVAEYVFPTLY